jgi:hypothetical protein
MLFDTTKKNGQTAHFIVFQPLPVIATLTDNAQRWKAADYTERMAIK